MSGLLPSTSDAMPPEGEPRVIGMDDADADDVISALSAATARSLLAEIYDEPATPSTLAERADTSLQNAQYHLEKLRDADLIEVIDTRYSEKGREMNVYGAPQAPVVLFAGSGSEGGDVRSALATLMGAVGVLGIASIAVQELVGQGIGALLGTGAGGDAGGAAPATTTQEAMMAAEEATSTPMATPTATHTAADGAPDAAMAVEQAVGLPPGLVFFLGGLVALAVIVLFTYVRR
jgi:DNA-binding transcriptional ArsR family regulator